MKTSPLTRFFTQALLSAAVLRAQGPANVLVVVNDASPVSRAIGEYYQKARTIPAANICHIRTTQEQDVTRQVYDREVAGPVGACLIQKKLVDQIYYIVTTLGAPLRIQGSDGMDAEQAAVDSELTLLYSDITRRSRRRIPGSIPNPFFGHQNDAFNHTRFPIYLVTRLAAYDLEGVRALVDRAKRAENRGKFVLDLRGQGDPTGDGWMKNAARQLPRDRVVLDESSGALYGQSGVIAYSSWGSNDRGRKQRYTGNQWLPGAIMTEYVSTNGRTFNRPPPEWNLSDWESPKLWFFGSPQTMTADYLQEGATGASGHVFEPYLIFTPRPDQVLPAYYRGRNLAESYYLGIPGLSWQNIVVGDPLCSLGKP